jgi:hypothetical protein
MELFLALAAIIVAVATLFFASTARRRFDAHEARLGKAEQNVASLRSGQQELGHSGQATRQAEAWRIQQLGYALKKLDERQERDQRAQAGRHQQAQEAIADVTKTVQQLRGELVVALEDQQAQLDSLGDLAEGHGSRLGSLDQLAQALQRSLNRLLADAAQLREQSSRQTAALSELGYRTTCESTCTGEKLADLGDQLLALAVDFGHLDLGRRQLQGQLRKLLRHGSQLATTAPEAWIMPGFIQAEHRAAAQILPCLYESLLRAAGFDFVFRENEAAGACYYLVPSSPGSQPEQQLENLLNACPISDTALAGLKELHCVLRAIHEGGPGIMRVGPLVVGHATGGMFSGFVLTAAEARTLDADDLASSSSQCLRLLGELPEERVVDLAAWAASAS